VLGAVTAMIVADELTHYRCMREWPIDWPCQSIGRYVLFIAKIIGDDGDGFI